MVTVKIYADLFKAQLDKTLLESYGIHAEVLDQNVNLITGFYNNDLLGIRLAVTDEDYEKASELLQTPSSTI